jgi:crotonobetainyl-CoA:carnitine CoA-transferase CaiB-like acyl-CoA transferase
MPFPETGGAKVMQGKESICVDITQPEGIAIVHQLVEHADLVLDGFRAGVAERIGIDAATLQRISPDLIWVSANGYGDGGPCGHRPAFAPSIGAASGLARANVGETIREAPGLSAEEIMAAHAKLSQAAAIPQAQADGFAALGVATSLLLGLLKRERGLGASVIASSMLATATHAMADQVVHVVGEPPRPGVSAELRGLSALYRIYDASDGWVFLAAPAAGDWEALVTGLSPYLDLGNDERFASPELRAANDATLVETLAAVFATGEKSLWEKQLSAADVGCVAVSTERLERFYQGEELGRASGYVTEVVHPTFDEHLRLTPLVRFSRSATQALPGVLAGSSTDAILAEIGYDEAAIADLREREIVGG